VLTCKIVSPRLIIRRYNPAGNDALLLKTSIDQSIEHLKPWMPWAWNEPEALEAKAKRIERFRAEFDAESDYTLGIFNLAETELIGSCGLHTRLEHNAREIGYWINVNHLQQGLATETVMALVRVGFEVEQLARIEIRHDANNIVSGLIPPKCGFTFKEKLSGNIKDVFGNDRDTMIWQITAQNYANMPSKKIAIKAFNKNSEQIL
jgi:RimJ/RimL family protein N-acetyltransferase